MIKQNNWTINRKYSYKFLNWKTVPEQRKLKFDEVISILENLDSWIKNSNHLELKEIQLWFDLEDNGKFIALSEYLKFNNFKDLLELIKDSKDNLDVTKKYFRTDIHQINFENLTEKNLFISNIVIGLNPIINFYNEKGEIVKENINKCEKHEEALTLIISNNYYKSSPELNQGFFITFASSSDVWLPETCYGRRYDETIINKDNLELARLNLPILNGILQGLIENTGFNFTVQPGKISEKNKELLEIKNDSIKFKNEN